MKMTHKYCEDFTLTVPASSLNGVVAPFSCNGMFDPQLTVGGHQPYYFDQMMAIYNHYIVLSSRIVVEAIALQSGALGNPDVPYTMGVYIDDDSTPASPLLTTMMENQSCVSKTKRGDNEPMVLKKKWDAKAAFGGNIMDNDDLQGNITANPVEEQVFMVWLGQPVPAAGATCQGVVTIYYDVVWDELKQVPGS